MVDLPNVYSILIVSFVLIACTITDIKNKTIEPWLCGVLVVASCLDPSKDYKWSLIGLAVGFIPFFLLALVGHGGGGDALLMGAIGWSVSIYCLADMMLYSTMLYALVLAVWVFITKDKKKQLPFAPFVLAAWVFLLMIGLH